MRCCAEIGKPGAWRQCRRRAKHRVWRSLVPGSIYSLEYCERHKTRISQRPQGAIQHGDIEELS